MKKILILFTVLTLFVCFLSGCCSSKEISDPANGIPGHQIIHAES